MYLPPEFEQGLAIQAGTAAALGSSNSQIAAESVSAFIAIDRRRGGLARPVSSKEAMASYGVVIHAATKAYNEKSLASLHHFRRAPTYNAAVGSVVITPDLTLLHTKTWRDLQQPSLAQPLW